MLKCIIIKKYNKKRRHPVFKKKKTDFHQHAVKFPLTFKPCLQQNTLRLSKIRESTRSVSSLNIQSLWWLVRSVILSATAIRDKENYWLTVCSNTRIYHERPADLWSFPTVSIFGALLFVVKAYLSLGVVKKCLFSVYLLPCT